MRLLDSRRLAGPGLLLDRAGAVLDVEIKDAASGESGDRRLAGRRDAHARCGRLGGERVAVRRYAGGASLAISAPPDALYASYRSQRLGMGRRRGRGCRAGRSPISATAGERLHAAIAAERNPALLAIRERRALARSHLPERRGDRLDRRGDAGIFSVLAKRCPQPTTVDWSRAHEIPVALVTGSNGKTTVVRLLAAMATAAGRVSGVTSTEGVLVRRASRRMPLATARAPPSAQADAPARRKWTSPFWTPRAADCCGADFTVERADVAVVTNIAADHLGEFGVPGSLGSWRKPSCSWPGRSEPGGRVVLNADDPVLVEASRAAVRAPIVWFSLDAGQRGDHGGTRKRAADRGGDEMGTRSRHSPPAPSGEIVTQGWRTCRWRRAAPPGTTSPTR